MPDTMNTEGTSKGAPWHLWVIGGIALIWNAIGAANYYVTQTMSPETLAGLDEATRSYMIGIPTWFHAAWAFAVWGSVIASFLLLFRRARAAPLFLLCLLSQFTCVAYAVAQNAYALPDGTLMMVMSGLVFAIALWLWLYARAMANRGVLV